MTSSSPNYLPKAHLQILPHVGLGCQHVDLGDDTVQSVAEDKPQTEHHKEPACLLSRQQLVSCLAYGKYSFVVQINVK